VEVIEWQLREMSLHDKATMLTGLLRPEGAFMYLTMPILSIAIWLQQFLIFVKLDFGQMVYITLT